LLLNRREIEGKEAECATNIDHQGKKRGKAMKKLAIQLFLVGAFIATYALPVLAHGGGGP
jgi:hypothetical protein